MKKYWIGKSANKSEVFNTQTSHDYAEPIPKQDVDHLRPQGEPLSKTEIAIMGVWSACLGVEGLSVFDDFFDLGGDSLLAVQLVGQLREIFDLQLSSHILTSASTVGELARAIDSLAGSGVPDVEQETAILLNKGTKKTAPIFLIHPAGGHVYFYRDIAKALDVKQRVYGIQARGLEGDDKLPLSSVEEMAGSYIEVIKSIQPKGPYYIAGTSFGGMVAYEIAQQFKRRGEGIALLAMMDTPGGDEMPRVEKPMEDIEVLAYFLRVGGNLPVTAEELSSLSHESVLQRYIEEEKK